MKQAYLITAYKNFDELYELAEILSKTAYVFIHVDEKSREITDADVVKRSGNTALYGAVLHMCRLS